MTFSPKQLQATLREITETLSRELAQPSREAPSWSDHEWTLARAVAVMHGVSPLLAQSLRWRGPDVWNDFLSRQRDHTVRRHARIVDLVRRIDEYARDRGIVAVALKGVALHSIGIYSAGERPMADIDLLVRPDDSQRTALMLESLGYRAMPASWKEQPFVPVEAQCVPVDTGDSESLGERAHAAIKIELHQRICERLPLRITDISERIFPIGSKAGLNGYPSTASLMAHLLLHAAGAMTSQTLRLLHLHDISALSTRMSAADWDELLSGAVGQRLWWGLPPLRMTSMYFAGTVPKDVIAALERECHWLLARASSRKTLTDVSYSHLWVDAFPGIEWTRSASEMLAFMCSRVWPSAEHLAIREVTFATQAWASANDWLGLPQSRRIAKWVTSRPQRPVTLHSVNTAIAQAR